MTGPAEALAQLERETGLAPAVARATRPWQAPSLRVLLVFGTRPELIKFLPLFREAERRPGVALSAVMTSQHTDLVRPLIDLW
nr:hypothetical protein [Paracoccaceae bacterium]